MSDSFKGEPSELTVGEVLTRLQENPEPLCTESLEIRVTKVVRARPNSKLDKLGVDFLVRLERLVGKAWRLIPVPLQVRSSGRHVREFQARMTRDKMPQVRCLTVARNQEAEAVMPQVIQCLRSAAETAMRGLRRIRMLFRSYLDETASVAPQRPSCVSSKEHRRRRRKGPFFYVPKCQMCH